MIAISDALRADIQKLIAFATQNSFEDMIKPTQLEEFSLMINPQVRVYYIHHAVAETQQVMAHLSVHGGGSSLNDADVAQLAMAFGLGPHSDWRAIIHRPSDPSSHIFKML